MGQGDKRGDSCTVNKINLPRALHSCYDSSRLKPPVTGRQVREHMLTALSIPAHRKVPVAVLSANL